MSRKVTPLGALVVVAGSQFDRVAGVAEIGEADALDHTAVGTSRHGIARMATVIELA